MSCSFTYTLYLLFLLHIDLYSFLFFVYINISLTVVYLGKNKKGQLQLSRKKVLEDRGVKPRGDSSRRMESRPSAPSPPTTEMSQEEIDVIAEAINNL